LFLLFFFLSSISFLYFFLQEADIFQGTESHQIVKLEET